MLPTTRKEANFLNEKYYLTGKLCPQGHNSKRYSHNGVCYDCVMESNKKWYDKNKTEGRINTKDNPHHGRFIDKIIHDETGR